MACSVCGSGRLSRRDQRDNPARARVPGRQRAGERGRLDRLQAPEIVVRIVDAREPAARVPPQPPRGNQRREHGGAERGAPNQQESEDDAGAAGATGRCRRDHAGQRHRADDANRTAGEARAPPHVDAAPARRETAQRVELAGAQRVGLGPHEVGRVAIGIHGRCAQQQALQRAKPASPRDRRGAPRQGGAASALPASAWQGHGSGDAPAMVGVIAATRPRRPRPRDRRGSRTR